MSTPPPCRLTSPVENNAKLAALNRDVEKVSALTVKSDAARSARRAQGFQVTAEIGPPYQHVRRFAGQCGPGPHESRLSTTSLTREPERTAAAAAARPVCCGR